MNIGNKIEEIRSKPEHIRERYVWMAVAICMLLVAGLWIFSFKSLFTRKEESTQSAPVKELIDKSKESIGEMPSIDSLKQ